MQTPPTRTVICGDAVKWIEEQTILPGSIVTGLPDYTEVQMKLDQWKDWFVHVCSLMFQRLDEKECIIIGQTDVKIPQEGHQYSEWVDKSYLCHKACENSDCKLMFHKIVAFNETIDSNHIFYGRLTGYLHLLCFRRKSCSYTETLPDVLYRGDQVWKKGTGLNAALAAIKYAKRIGSKCIIDPFCGKGSALAVANRLGLNAIGVEIKPGLCRNAMNLQVDKRGCFVWRDNKGEHERSTEEQEDPMAEQEGPIEELQGMHGDQKDEA